MYNTGIPSNTPDLKVSGESLTSQIEHGLQEIINQQQEAVYQIEERLHSLLNRRVPAAKEVSAVSDISDFKGSMDSLLNSLQGICLRLQTIQNHITEII